MKVRGFVGVATGAVVVATASVAAPAPAAPHTINEEDRQ